MVHAHTHTHTHTDTRARTAASKLDELVEGVDGSAGSLAQRPERLVTRTHTLRV
jgi:hypothetical protein